MTAQAKAAGHRARSDGAQASRAGTPLHLTGPAPRHAAWTYVYGQELPNTFANSGAVMHLCRALAAAGRTVRLAYAGPGSDEAPIRQFYRLGREVGFVPLGHRRGPGHYPAMALAACRRARDGLIITRMPQVAALCATLGRPTVLELHQHLDTFSHWRQWRQLLRLVPPGRLAVAALTDALAEKLDPLLAARAAATMTIGSAAPDLAMPNAASPYEAGYIGSFMPGKGIERVLELARSMPAVRFVAYGDPSRAPDMAASLAALDNVTLGGFVSPADIGRALASFRIGLAPYATTGFGLAGAATVTMDSMSSLKILEYMSAARTIVASRIPSVATLLADEGNAILCNADAPEDWRAAICRLLASPDLSRRLAETARHDFEKRHSYAARAKAFLTLAEALHA